MQKSEGALAQPATSPDVRESLLTDESALLTVLAQIRRDLADLRQALAGARKDYYTVEEVARLVGRSAYTVRRWITEGRIRATRVTGTGPRGKLLVPRDQLAVLIETGRGGEITSATLGTPVDRREV